MSKFSQNVHWISPFGMMWAWLLLQTTSFVSPGYGQTTSQVTFRFLKRMDEPTWELLEESHATTINQRIPPNIPFPYVACPAPFYCFANILTDSNGNTDLLAWEPSTDSLYLRDSFQQAERKSTLWADFSQTHYQPKLPTQQQRFLGDFDGDGYVDVIILAQNFLVDAYLANGKGKFALEREIAFPFPKDKRGGFIREVDWDQDGLSDFVQRDNSTLPLQIARNVPQNAFPEDHILTIAFSLQAPIRHILPWGPISHILFGNTETPLSLNELNPNEYHLMLFLDSSEEREYQRIYERHFSRLNKDQVFNFVIDPPERKQEPRIIGRLFEEGIQNKTRPKICLGYVPLHSTIVEGRVKWNFSSGSCPSGFAYISASEGGEQGPAGSWLMVQCCPLPADDILLNQHLWVIESCPDGYIATGHQNSNFGEYENWMRCTKVNEERYFLGSLTPGVYWGSGYSSRGQGRKIDISEIPLAIRYGVLRSARKHISVDGCIGSPFGSFLVQKGASHCTEFGFRQLLYRGITGDPAPGTPVQIYPECSEIEDVFFGNSGCFPKNSSNP